MGTFQNVFSSIFSLILSFLLLMQATCTMRPEGRQLVFGDENSKPNAPGNNSTGNAGNTTSEIPVQMSDATCTNYQVTRAQVLSPLADEVQTWLKQMTLEQKLAMLNGGEICPNWDCDFDATGVPELGIADFKMRDGPRGVHQLSGGKSTTWAVAEARAASFDLDLEYRVGKLQGLEMRAFKYDLSLAPTINVLRHPGWARAQETYGEDPVLIGEMGAAFVRGMQESVPACPKHFAGNNTDNNRNTTIAKIDEQTLRENYTRAFKIIVEKADPGCIMAAYNGVNGDWCTENHHLLTEILRDDWHWNGFVLSDWWATKKHGDLSINAGLDLEMPDKRAFEQLPDAVRSGKVKASRVDEAVTRILNVRAKFKQFTTEYKNSPADPNIVNQEAHKRLAQETAEKGAVLLKNDNLLPLGPKAEEAGLGMAQVKSILFLGPDAEIPTTNVNKALVASGLGDRGSSNTNPPYAVSFMKGVAERAPGITVSASQKVEDAAKADVVIIPVTMAHEDEGEAFDGGQDRWALTLSGTHPKHWAVPKPAEFINQVAKINKNVIVLLAVGSAIVMEDWIESAKAIIQTFYPGQEGGHALARLLFGDLNFSGKLPFTVAKNIKDYPLFQNTIGTSTFDYFHGYRKFEKEGLQPRFWFGYGKSYTLYEYRELEVLCPQGITENGRLNVEVTVGNKGKVAGEEIIQLYIGYPHSTARRPKKELKAFKRVSLLPGQSKKVQFYLPTKEMATWSNQGWLIEKGEQVVLVGPSADPSQLLSKTFTIK